MPPITSLRGESLLESGTVEEIKKQADLLLKQKDVAAAWQAASHIKKELGALPAEKISVFLTEYRKISANLKALAFPLLEQEEALNLLERNLQFVSGEYLPSLAVALSAWVDLQDNSQETKEKILKLLEKGGSAGAQLAASLSGEAALAAAAPEGLAKKSELAPSYEMFNQKERDELVQHASRVNKINPSALATGGADGVAEKIFLSAKPNLDKESFSRRAQALITSRLRDVRTTAQLNEYLSRPFAVGGLGLQGANLEQANRLIEEEYQKLHQISPALPKVALPAEELMPSLGELEEKEDLAPEILPIPEIKKMPAKIPPLSPVATPLPSASGPSVFERPRDVKAATVTPQAAVLEPPKKEATPNLAQVRNLVGSDKNRVADIKSPALSAPGRTLSAADELKLLTLADFRGWGKEAEAIGEIMRRIGLLTKESLTSKMQGIKMFHDSELFKDYVRIGQASLSAGKKLSEAIADKAINPNQMTEGEFFALASLNSKLK